MTSFDGDPDKLASYILALAKKVENDQASRDRCIKDLQVFLETNTNNFVDSLFETLNNKKYLTQTQTQPPQNENKTDDLTNRKKVIDKRNKKKHKLTIKFQNKNKKRIIMTHHLGIKTTEKEIDPVVSQTTTIPDETINVIQLIIIPIETLIDIVIVFHVTIME